jgi:opacity protein-like surface antigen
VTLSLGTTSSGPANDIEEAMIASGFNHDWGWGESPSSVTGWGGVAWMIALQYRTNPRLSLGVVVSNAPIGHTSGEHSPLNVLSVDYSVSTLSPTVSYRFSDYLHLGIGPAIYSAEASSEDLVGTESGSQSATKFGILLDFGLSIPAHSRFFAIFSAQYRYVGNMTIGPFESTFLQDSATMPATSVSYNHYFVSVGLGIRL